MMRLSGTLTRRRSWRSAARSAVALCALLSTGGVVGQAVPLPEGFVQETVVRGLAAPVDLAFASDGRLFVLEKAGRVRVVVDGLVLETPFLDLSAEVNDLGDRGMVGLALHPRFPEEPYVYVSYAYDPPEVQAATGAAGPDGEGTRVSRLVRVTADAARDHAVALPGSAVVLLGRNSTFEHMGDPAVRNPEVPSCGRVGEYVQDCLPADEHSHTIGRLRFGPDGALYVGSGDGADYHTIQPYHVRAQDLDSLAGKLLRIDPATGRGLPDNPFWNGDPDANRSKVLNHGLRNPYSFSFDPATWEPIIGDVGWATWEEVNVGVGRNFGWPCYEGGDQGNLVQGTFAIYERCQALYADPTADVTPPVYAYDRTGTGAAIIVGDVYVGDAFPEAYRGLLFFADYYQLRIQTIAFGADGRVTDVVPFASAAYPVKIATGPDGALYYLNVWEGAVLRVRYAPPAGAAPEVRIRATPAGGAAPLTVQFDVDVAFANGAGALAYRWDFGGGRTSALERPEGLFFRGMHDVLLEVTAEDGSSARATTTVRVGVAAPAVTIERPLSGATYAVGDVVEFRGSAVDGSGAPVPDERLRWSLEVRRGDAPGVPGLPPATVGSSGSFYAADRGAGAVLELCLTAEDDEGVPGRACLELEPR